MVWTTASAPADTCYIRISTQDIRTTAHDARESRTQGRISPRYSGGVPPVIYVYSLKICGHERSSLRIWCGPPRLRRLTPAKDVYPVRIYVREHRIYVREHTMLESHLPRVVYHQVYEGTAAEFRLLYTCIHSLHTGMKVRVLVDGVDHRVCAG